MPRNAGRGRPSLCTPETAKRVVRAIKASATYEHAARYAGIAPGTFHRYMATGETHLEEGIESPYRDFYETVSGTLSDAAVGMLEEVRKDRDWRAKAWILEHRHPDHYGRRPPQTLIQTGISVNSPAQEVQLSLRELTDGDLVQLEALVTRMRLPAAGNGSNGSSDSSNGTTSTS